MGPHEIKRLLYSDGHHHLSEETACRTGKIFNSYTSDSGLVYKIYKELKKYWAPRKRTTRLKWSMELSRQFSEDGIQIVEKHLLKLSTALATKLKLLWDFIIDWSELKRFF